MVPPEGRLVVDQASLLALALEQPLFPDGVVGELQGQRRALRDPAGAPRAVRGRQVAEVHVQRVIVGGDPVHRQRQHVLPLRDCEQGAAPRHVTGEVEGPLGPFGDKPGELLLGDRNRRQLNRRGVVDVLVDGRGLAGEGRPEDLVPGRDVTERRLQRGHVQPAAHAQRDRGVHARGRLPGAGQQPGAELPGGEGHLLRPGGGLQRGT